MSSTRRTVSVDPFRAATLPSVAQAVLAFAAGVAAPLGILALLPDVSHEAVSNRGFALLAAVFLVPAPFLHLFAYLRQLTTHPQASTRARLATSFLSALAFMVGWVPFAYVLAVLLAPLDTLRLPLPTDGLAFAGVLSYCLLGPLFLPFLVGPLLLKSRSKCPPRAAA